MKKTKKIPTMKMKANGTIDVSYQYDRDDLNAIAVHLLFTLIVEEDWYEDEVPTDTELALKVSKTWVMNELKSQFRNHGACYSQLLYDKITASKHARRYKALSKVADARVAELFKE